MRADDFRHQEYPQRLARRVAELAARLAADSRLGAELQRARRDFFGVGAAGVGAAADPMAEHRFAEWFLLERDSETLGDVPIALPQFGGSDPDLDGSFVGVYLVQVETGGGATAVDLQNGDQVDFAAPAGALRAGDLLVGRCYPMAAGDSAPSVAAAVFRPGHELAAAFQRDLARLDLSRRLQQVELERLLLRRPGQQPAVSWPPAGDSAEPPLEHLEARLDAELGAAGAGFSAGDISQALAASERPGAVMGPLLDQLAFETDVDLDRVRRLLVEIWNAHHRGMRTWTDASPAPATEGLGAQLARALDEGLRDKRDITELFAQLERMVGLDGDDADQDGDGRDAAGADGGNLGALVEEFLWETGAGGAARATALRLWVEMQRRAPLPRTDLEVVLPADLLRLLLHVYLGAAASGRAAAVRAAFADLEAFLGWAAATQEIDLRAQLQQCRGALLDQIDRLQAAGEALSSAAAPEAGPGILQIEDKGPDGIGVRDDDGEHHWIQAAAGVVAQLRIGDLVLGSMTRAAGANAARVLVGPVVVLPIDARALIE